MTQGSRGAEFLQEDPCQLWETLGVVLEHVPLLRSSHRDGPGRLAYMQQSDDGGYQLRAKHLGKDLRMRWGERRDLASLLSLN